MTASFVPRSRGGTRIGRARRGFSRRKSGNTGWRGFWADPWITLAPGVTGAIVAISEADLADMTSPTLVGGFVQASGFIRNINAPTDAPAAGYLIIGMRVLPSVTADIADTPDPFNDVDGDWMWYRSIPLIDAIAAGSYDQSNSFMLNDQIRSKRRVPEDSQVVIVYTFLDADFHANAANVDFVLSGRLLFREA